MRRPEDEHCCVYAPHACVRVYAREINDASVKTGVFYADDEP